MDQKDGDPRVHVLPSHSRVQERGRHAGPAVCYAHVAHAARLLDRKNRTCEHAQDTPAQLPVAAAAGLQPRGLLPRGLPALPLSATE